jgi:hypothetical protein
MCQRGVVDFQDWVEAEGIKEITFSKATQTGEFYY